MPNLVGIGNSQVPTNAMLGGLAYQDSVGEINLEKIKARTADTAVAPFGIFVYDTSKDSDGGAWRKTTQSTSWYNEGVSEYRGDRKEFPSIAVIVVESDRVVIYDGDDSDLPMWMIFKNEGQIGAASNMLTAGVSGQTNTCVHALNGDMVVGVERTAGSSEGLFRINFISERAIIYRTEASGYTASRWTGNIKDRNYLTIGSSQQMASNCIAYWEDNDLEDIRDLRIKDVSMVVERNAPLDEISGLPIPTVGAASTTAVNIVLPYVGDRNTGPITIKLMPEDIAGYDAIKTMEAIDFDEDGKCIWTTSQTGSAFRNIVVTARPASNFADIAANYSQLGGNTFSMQWTGQIARHITNNGTVTNNRGYGGSAGIGNWKTYNPSPSQIYPTFAGENILITDNGNANSAPIMLFDKKSLFEHESPLYAHITKDYNTGWMPPETRSVLLADTDDTDLTGTELITNGTSATISTSDWSIGNATVSIVNVAGRNYLKILNTGNSQAYAYQGFSTTSGKSYVISFRLHQDGSNAMACWLRMGTSGNGVNVLNVNNHGEGTYAYTFEASSSTTYASFFVTNTGANRYNLVTDVSVREVQVYDRSKWTYGQSSPGFTFQGAKVNGSGLTRTKVGTGSDLVYYTGWSSSNYLTLGAIESNDNLSVRTRTNSPNNASPEDIYEFGTGDYFMMGWFWCNYVGGGQYLIKREDTDLSSNGDSTRHWSVWIAADLKYIAHYVGGNAYHSANNAYTNRSWTHFCVGRDGKNIKTYINGRLFQQWYSGGSSTVSMNSAHPVTIGYSCNSATRLALMRFGKGFPSERDIEKIYQEERELFSDNVNCTLYGTSNDIKANCYDSGTGLYHVGTSSGRSDFSGLKRINNTTTAVTSSLSASNGFIAEQ